MGDRSGSPVDRRIPISRLVEEPYSLILCYPRPDPAEIQARVRELEKLGVREVGFEGGKLVGKLHLLGKGCVGIVVKAYTADGVAALKIRRVDADRRDMAHESEMLRLANGVGVGPRLHSATENFLLMEFIDGEELRGWVLGLPARGSRRRLRSTLVRILTDCHKLDSVGLDHGELSSAPKNVLIDAQGIPHIVDFETASTGRRPSNVTSIAQYLLIGGEVSKRIRAILGLRRRANLIEALKAYKANPGWEGLEAIMRAARIVL